MAHPFLAILHAGHGQELTLLEYLYRVLFHLAGLGAIAVVAFWWSCVVDAVRSVLGPPYGSSGDHR